jgi:hypothetical protein
MKIMVLTFVIHLVICELLYDTTGCYTVTVEMLLWEADLRDKHGEKQEAAKIRGWVADFFKRAIEGRQIGLARGGKAMSAFSIEKDRRKMPWPQSSSTQNRSKQDALITNIILCIGIVVFLAESMHGFLYGLLAAIIVTGFLYTAWCIFFRAPTTRQRIVLGVVCIPLYLWYALYVWLAFRNR